MEEDNIHKMKNDLAEKKEIIAEQKKEIHLKNKK